MYLEISILNTDEHIRLLET